MEFYKQGEAQNSGRNTEGDEEGGRRQRYRQKQVINALRIDISIKSRHVIE